MAEPDDIAPLLMNQADYARHRKVSKQAIGNAVEAGKITLDDNGMIDVVATDRALGESRQRINEPREAETGGSAQLTRARTFEAVYRARSAQLDYETKVGNVVPTAGVADAAAECAEVAIRAIRTISGRAEAAMAAAKDVFAMRAFLKGIEREVQAQIAAGFEKMASAAVAGREIPEAVDEPDEMRAETFDDAN